MDLFRSPLILAGRILLALLFLLAGIDKLTDIAGTAAYITSVGLPMATPLAVLSGVFEVLAALALSVGWQARWAALGLALFTVLTNVLFHKYWALPDNQAFVEQILFMKNASIAGGLLVVAAHGAGPVSFDACQIRRREQSQAAPHRGWETHDPERWLDALTVAAVRRAGNST